MRHILARSTATIVLALLATAAAAFDLVRAKTEAAVVDPGSESPAIALELTTSLRGDLPELRGGDLVATWERAGGIDPTPFVVTLPAGCLMANDRGFHVDDFRACGASIELEGTELTLIVLEGSWIVTGDGTSRMGLRALFGVPREGGSAVLGALGGANVEVAVGTEISQAPLLEVQTLSGIEPQPF